MNEIKSLIERIETGTRVEGDPDCVFFGGHWHGEPVEGGTVGVLSEGELVSVPTPEFVVDGKILWDLDENGGVHQPGTLEKKAAEEAKAAEEITPEPPHPDAIELGPDVAPEPAPEDPAPEVSEALAQATPSQEVAQAPAEQQDTPASPGEGTDAPVPSLDAPVEQPAEAAPSTPQEATDAPAETVADAPAETTAEPAAVEEPAADPVVKKKRKSSDL